MRLPGRLHRISQPLSLHVPPDAVATAHVPQHAYGGAYYALKAIAAADPAHALTAVQAEYEWQFRQLTEDIREEIMKRIVIRRSSRGVTIIIDKTGDF
ncbi:MAG: Uncharacterized protein XE11_0871 [Methanomicrobiales archaeon 53_19]|nr:MAG: Uncharacterized protein XD88_0973 [Methanocalculus sp. 52_23]KUL04010.1 MAG: Uncharacterized protein XE11_0871 [Methanomicrobiales archaeon 53_19]